MSAAAAANWVHWENTVVLFRLHIIVWLHEMFQLALISWQQHSRPLMADSNTTLKRIWKSYTISHLSFPRVWFMLQGRWTTCLYMPAFCTWSNARLLLLIVHVYSYYSKYLWWLYIMIRVALFSPDKQMTLDTSCLVWKKKPTCTPGHQSSCYPLHPPKSCYKVPMDCE